MYYPNIAERPITVLGLWNGQPVEFNGVLMRFNTMLDAKGQEDVCFTTLDSNPDVNAYEQDLNAYLLGTLGATRPVYADYYRHLRRNGTYGILTRQQFVDALTAGNCTIG